MHPRTHRDTQSQRQRDTQTDTPPPTQPLADTHEELDGSTHTNTVTKTDKEIQRQTDQTQRADV